MIDRGEEASIKIKTLRERVIESVSYRPFEAARRVFIIDPADAMTVEAQDALLKTLEEPPSAAILILVIGLCRHAAADDPVALPPAAIRPARRGRHRARARWRKGVDAASARALAASAGGIGHARAGRRQDEFDDDRDAALALLAAARGRRDRSPAQSLRRVWRSHDSDRRDREALVATARRSCCRSCGTSALSARRRPCRSPTRTLRRCASLVPRLTSTALRRPSRRRSGARGARSERQPEDRGRLGRGDDLTRLSEHIAAMASCALRSPLATHPASDRKSPSRPSADPRVIAVCRPVLYGPHTAEASERRSRAARSSAASGRAAYDAIVKPPTMPWPGACRPSRPRRSTKPRSPQRVSLERPHGSARAPLRRARRGDDVLVRQASRRSRDGAHPARRSAASAHDRAAALASSAHGARRFRGSVSTAPSAGRRRTESARRRRRACWERKTTT